MYPVVETKLIPIGFAFEHYKRLVLILKAELQYIFRRLSKNYIEVSSLLAVGGWLYPQTI